MTKKQKHQEKRLSTYIIVGPMPFNWKTLTPYLSGKTKLFFVDGGFTHHEKFKKKAPSLFKTASVIGDGDSSTKDMTIKKSDQNLSDLAFFLQRMAGKKTSGEYIFAGFLGGRLDHQFFNLGEIWHFVRKMKTKVHISIEDKIEFLPAGKNSIEHHGVFSLLSLEKNQVKISGQCLYKSKTWLPLPLLSSRGLSNVGSGIIELESKLPLVIFYS